MNSARELKIATGVRVVGRDMSAVTFLAESEAQAQSPSRGSETCRGDSERFSDYRGGLRGAVTQVATWGRNVNTDRAATCAIGRSPPTFG